MMDSARVVDTKSAPVKTSIPKVEQDGEIDVEDHQLNSMLEKEAKDLESGMARRVSGKPQLAAAETGTKVTSGDATMTRQMRASRWLNAHGMQKMGQILSGRKAASE